MENIILHELLRGRHNYQMIKAANNISFTWLLANSFECIQTKTDVTEHQRQFHPGRGKYCIYYCLDENSFLLVYDTKYLRNDGMRSLSLFERNITNGSIKIRHNEDKNDKLLDLLFKSILKGRSLSSYNNALPWFKRAFYICYHSCYDIFTNGWLTCYSGDEAEQELRNIGTIIGSTIIRLSSEPGRLAITYVSKEEEVEIIKTQIIESVKDNIQYLIDEEGTGVLAYNSVKDLILNCNVIHQIKPYGINELVWKNDAVRMSNEYKFYGDEEFNELYGYILTYELLQNYIYSVNSDRWEAYANYVNSVRINQNGLGAIYDVEDLNYIPNDLILVKSFSGLLGLLEENVLLSIDMFLDNINAQINKKYRDFIKLSNPTLWTEIPGLIEGKEIRVTCVVGNGLGVIVAVKDLHPIEEEEEKKEEKQEENRWACPICADDGENEEYSWCISFELDSNGENACGHKYHTECIKQYINYQEQNNHDVNCVICRRMMKGISNVRVNSKHEGKRKRVKKSNGKNRRKSNGKK
jgi:hypothetical protein